MLSSKFIAGAAVVVAVVSVGGVFYEMKQLRFAAAALSFSEQKQTELRADIVTMGARLQAESKRAQAAEDANAKLAEAADRALASAKANLVVQPAPVTRESVQGRYQQAKQLALKGDFAAALKELLWCYDEGMQQVPGFEGVRQSEVPKEIAKFGVQFPPALMVLHDRRDKAEERFLTRAGEFDAAVTLANLNRALREEAHTLALYDQLPANDPRRRPLARAAFPELVAARRYAEAVQGKSVEQMNAEFKTTSTMGAAMGVMSSAMLPDHSTTKKVPSPNLILFEPTARNIEALAGAGDAAHASELIGKLLAADDRVSTRTQLQERLTRAGHPELLP